MKINLKELLNIVSLDIKAIINHLHHYPITKNVSYYYGNTGSVSQIKWDRDEKRIVLLDPDREIDVDLRQASSHLRLEVFSHMPAFIEACKEEMEEDVNYAEILDVHLAIQKLIGEDTCNQNK